MIRHQFVNYSVNFKTNLNIFLRNKYNKQPEKKKNLWLFSPTFHPFLFCAFYECKFLMLIQCDCDMRMNDVKQKKTFIIELRERKWKLYIEDFFSKKEMKNKYKNIIKRMKRVYGGIYWVEQWKHKASAK